MQLSVLPFCMFISYQKGTNPTIDTQLDAYDEFYKDLENDLMPFIENHYSVATGR